MSVSGQTDESSGSFELRWSPAWTSLLAAIWALGVGFAAWPAFLDNLEHYREYGGKVYFAALGGLAGLASCIVLHYRVRRWTAKYELVTLAGLALAACLLKEPVATAVILLLAGSALGIGRSLQRRSGLLTGSYIADIGFCGTLGLGVLTVAMMALGATGAISVSAAIVLLILPCLIFRRALVELWRGAAAPLESWRRASAEDDWIPTIAIVSVVIFGAFTLAIVLTPSLSLDGIGYHLPLARHYAESGSLAPLPGLTRSYLPQAVELLMALAYSLGGLSAMQFVNPLFFVLCLPVVYALTRACGFSRSAGLLAVIAGAGAPFVHWAGSVVKVDLAVPLFQLASLGCFVRGRRDKSFNWLLAGLLFLALSVGAKLTAIYGAIPLALLHAYLLWGLLAAKARFRPAQIVTLLVLVVGIAPFWQIRAFWTAGSPWYPLNTDFLSSPIAPLIGERPGVLEAYLQYPWIVHFKGRMSFEGVSENPAGMFLVLVAPAWLFIRRTRTNATERALLFFAALSYLYWGFMWAFIRYGIPMFLAFYALSAGRVVELSRRSGRIFGSAVAAGLTACLLFSVAVTALYEVNEPQLRYLAGRMSEREFLLASNRFYPVLEQLGRIAKPGERVLSVGNSAALYAPELTSFYSTRPNSAASILKQLSNGSFRYLITSVAHRERYLAPLSSVYELELLYEDEHYLLYRIGGA